MKVSVKKFSIMLLMSGMLFSCGDDKGTNRGEEPNDKEESKVLDLSAEGMANCYIVTSSGKYKFKADNQFNLGEGLPVPPSINPVSAELIWQSGKDLIKEVELVMEEGNAYVNFEVVKAEGNALIAVCDESGAINWSWHIWMPVEEIYSITSDTGYEVMNMNLGALCNTAGDANSYGMLYQWGRKEPFPASATLTGDVNTLSAPMYDAKNNKVVLSNSSWTNTNDNTLEYSISHPTIVLSNYSQYSVSRDWLRSDMSEDNLWGNPLGYEKDETTGEYINQGRKTCYDPSPYGWRVPPADVFSTFTPGGYAWDFDMFNIYDLNGDGEYNLADYNYGWHFMINVDTPLYFPAASRFDGSYAMLMGSMSGLWGNYWSNSAYDNMPGGAMSVLAFQIKDQNGADFVSVSPSAASSRADAFSVRCIRDNN